MYTKTHTTPLANGVTPDKLIKVLHHHATMLEVLVPRKLGHEQQQDDVDSNTNHSQPPSPRGSSVAEKLSSFYSASYTTSTSDPSASTAYTVSEPGTFGIQRFAVQISGRSDGCDTLVFLPGGARIQALWTVEVEVLIEAVEVRAGCWNRRSARKRVADHFPRQHAVLMQLAATSKSMTDSYPLLPGQEGS